MSWDQLAPSQTHVSASAPATSTPPKSRVFWLFGSKAMAAMPRAGGDVAGCIAVQLAPSQTQVSAAKVVQTDVELSTLGHPPKSTVRARATSYAAPLYTRAPGVGPAPPASVQLLPDQSHVSRTGTHGSESILPVQPPKRTVCAWGPSYAAAAPMSGSGVVPAAGDDQVLPSHSHVSANAPPSPPLATTPPPNRTTRWRAESYASIAVSRGGGEVAGDASAQFVPSQSHVVATS